MVKAENLCWQLARSVALKLQNRLGIGIGHKRLCLVTGAPRSGTSAMCQWLGAHPDIASFYESRILIALHRFMQEVERFYYLDKHRKELTLQARHLAIEYYGNQGLLMGHKLLLDKEPLEPLAFPDGGYSAFLDNVRLLFPGAKFIFMLRDPIATVWSMRQREWGYTLVDQQHRTYSIEEHTHTWCQSVDLILDSLGDPECYICRFSRLNRAPAEESRRIFEFLKISAGTAFATRPTQTVGFSQEDRDTIVRIAAPQIEALAAHGMLDTVPGHTPGVSLP